ncbi:uncharacterized protein LOC131573859 isoform X4 [Poecile atricapillus]|uniref:uncharacterized protein LOC131573859 isoform X4 n=1 Tax=Poecile atricapillus TaxID=48891 RepID=UPI002738B64D|nr:uncharacterized protein LOC131573859 isoform X4 [Poecile atricapillus]
MGALGGMRRNVEVKARLRAREEVLRAALRLRELLGPGPGSGQGSGEHREPAQVCPEGGQVLIQTDTFFRVPRGRLKLRRMQDGRGQLIFYDRPDMAGPKLSSFSISPTADPEGLQVILSQALGTLGAVRKERLLLLLGQTRLHLDQVQGLGDFLELEVVLRPEQSEQDGQRVAQELLQHLGVQEQDLISGAYLDLLLARGHPGDTLGTPPGTRCDTGDTLGTAQDSGDTPGTAPETP